MPSKLGAVLRERRLELDIGLRELARRIKKSPALLTRLESEDNPPTVGPETLRAIAEQLELDPDRILVIANRTEEMAPRTELELALYRRVRELPKIKQRALLKDLSED